MTDSKLAWVHRFFVQRWCKNCSQREEATASTTRTQIANQSGHHLASRMEVSGPTEALLAVNTGVNTESTRKLQSVETHLDIAAKDSFHL